MSWMVNVVQPQPRQWAFQVSAILYLGQRSTSTETYLKEYVICNDGIHLCDHSWQVIYKQTLNYCSTATTSHFIFRTSWSNFKRFYWYSWIFKAVASIEGKDGTENQQADSSGGCTRSYIQILNKNLLPYQRRDESVVAFCFALPFEETLPWGLAMRMTWLSFCRIIVH